jgi:S1-C subfamily serine protease
MATPSVLSQLSTASAEAASRAAGAIVQVHGRPRRPASGVVVAPERVLTTAHSVEWEDDHLKVRADDGRVLPATLAGRDPRSDVALLRVAGLQAPPLPSADDVAPTGSIALILGRTWAGHLRARLTVLTSLPGPLRIGRGGAFDRLFALDVGPYPGFSGSAVVLPDGRLAGLATAGLIRATGLALPAPTLRQIADGLEQHGSVKRGYLGITSQPVEVPARQRANRDSGDGLLILSVADGSPADAAGLLIGDVLVAFDGTPVDDPETLLGLLGSARIGQATPITVLRGGAVHDMTVIVGDRSAAE